MHHKANLWPVCQLIKMMMWMCCITKNTFGSTKNAYVNVFVCFLVISEAKNRFNQIIVIKISNKKMHIFQFYTDCWFFFWYYHHHYNIYGLFFGKNSISQNESNQICMTRYMREGKKYEQKISLFPKNAWLNNFLWQILKAKLN